MSDTEHGHEHDEVLQRHRDARLRQELRRAKALLQLLEKRPELRDVIPLADLTGERLLWSA
jgi:hypothetical protein